MWFFFLNWYILAMHNNIHHREFSSVHSISCCFFLPFSLPPAPFNPGCSLLSVLPTASGYTAALFQAPLPLPARGATDRTTLETVIQMNCSYSVSYFVPATGKSLIISHKRATEQSRPPIPGVDCPGSRTWLWTQGAVAKGSATIAPKMPTHPHPYVPLASRE